ncbi:MAG: patatin-like phospholipase family protein [Imperialibacter sp.]|uniref:patatin-like phospholipase family protein n=1 Tax=Imperialibacter sp. TaxID=2038411 RepID=UPI0032ED62DE
MGKRLALLLSMSLIYCCSFSQKVALVFSGGGAKGLAHAGVIKALEENNIPIDYIVGTSMGSIVGGFYAAGYSADQIMEIALSQDIQNWVKGVIRDDYNYYYTQKDPDARWMSVELSLDSAFTASFSANIAEDHALNFALAEHLAQASRRAGYNFDSLFVPFRAMAAEVFTQQAVLLSDGNLSDALRASMTVPFFFRPIKFDGKYLFDGGIYNNFPVDIAIEEFKPDIIIGVNVASKVYKEYPSKEADHLVNEQLLFLMLDKSDPTRLEGNIYIEPNLEGLSSTDFARVKSITDSGYVETMRQMEFIKSKISRRVEKEEIASSRNSFKSDFVPLDFSEVEVEGFNSRQTKYLDNLLEKKNKIVELEKIKSGYYKIVSEDYFRSMYPQITKSETSDNYKLKLTGSPHRKVKMILGGTMTSRSTSNLLVGAQYKRLGQVFTHFDGAINAGRFYQSAKASARLYFPTYIPFYLEPKYVYNKWDFINSTEILLKDKAPTIVNQVDRNFTFNISTPLGTHHKLTFSPGLFYTRDNFAAIPEVNTSDVLDELRLKGFMGKIKVRQSNLNFYQYPTKGEAFEGSVGGYHASEKYFPGSTSGLAYREASHSWLTAKISYEKYNRLLSWYGIGYQVVGHFSTFPTLSSYRGTQVAGGGYYPFQDSRTLILENFRSNKFAAGGLKQMFFVRDNLHFRMEGHFFAPLQLLEKLPNEMPVYRQNTRKIFFAASAGVVFQSPIGPIAFAANYYDDEEQKWGALFHLGYLLFNERAFD